MKKDIKQADSILSSLFNQNNWSKGMTYSEFFRSWSQIVDQNLAAHSKIIEIEHNTAVVAVDHSAWLQKILFQKKRILTKLKSRYPELEIKDIRFIVKDFRKNEDRKTVQFDPSLIKLKKSIDTVPEEDLEVLLFRLKKEIERKSSTNLNDFGS